MNLEIALWLAQDAVTNGAIYALLALALIVVYTVTRVIFVPQGEFVSFAALSLGNAAGRQGAGNGLSALVAAWQSRWSMARRRPPKSLAAR